MQQLVPPVGGIPDRVQLGNLIRGETVLAHQLEPGAHRVERRLGERLDTRRGLDCVGRSGDLAEHAGRVRRQARQRVELEIDPGLASGGLRALEALHRVQDRVEVLPGRDHRAAEPLLGRAERRRYDGEVRFEHLAEVRVGWVVRDPLEPAGDHVARDFHHGEEDVECKSLESEDGAERGGNGCVDDAAEYVGQPGDLGRELAVFESLRERERHSRD